jgi:predicted amidohydrolase
VGTCTLVAVQAALEPEHYLSAAAFRAHVLALTEEAAAGGEGPTLVAFPEAVGLPLLLLLDAPARVRRARTLPAALAARLGPNWRAALASALRRPQGGLASLLLPEAAAAHRAYHAAFAEAARTFGVTVVAGSAFLPVFDQEALRGLHLRDGRVYNQGAVYGPHGRSLGSYQKTRLTPGLESRLGLARGQPQAQHPFETALGRVGVAICLDAFFESVAARMDGLGARVLVQPSANFAAWDRPWPGDPRLSEGEAWFRHGLRAQLQDRESLRYGVNPMLVGEFFGLIAEGRSSLVVNTRYHPGAAAGWPGLLAVAERHDRAAVVRARCPLWSVAAG